MKKLFSFLKEKYQLFKTLRRLKGLQSFQANFEKQMKKRGVSLVAMKDPKNPENILLEFVLTEAMDKMKEEMLNEQGDPFADIITTNDVDGQSATSTITVDTSPTNSVGEN